jgi:hypothetical protein
MTVIVHAGQLKIPTAASCTTCFATWQAPAIGAIRADYERFCGEHRHQLEDLQEADVPDWPEYPFGDHSDQP